MIKIHWFLRFWQVVVSVAILSGGLAFAQSKPTDEYAALLHRGTKAEMQGRLNEALEAFIPAYQIKQEYKVACTIARLAFRVQERHLIEAAEYYELCKRTADRPKTKAGIARRIAELNELEVTKAHLITVAVQAEPGASIYLNDQFAGVAPLRFSLFLEPGKSVIEVRKDGQSIKREVEGTRGETLSLQLTHPAVAPAAPVEALPSPPPLYTLPTFSPALEKEPARPVLERVRVSRTPWQKTRPVLTVALGAAALANLGAAFVLRDSALEAKKAEAEHRGAVDIHIRHGRLAEAAENASAAGAEDAKRVIFHNLMITAFAGAGVMAAGAITIGFMAGPSPLSGDLGLAGRFIW